MSDPKRQALDPRRESTGNFLKAVYELQQTGERVRTGDLAKVLDIKAPSVHDIINRCEEAGYIEHISHRGVRLTAEGEKIALEILRHHRLIELYLVTALGYAWDEVHEEAENLEHHISEKLEARIAAYLGNPTIDPHGDPIPALDGSLPELDLCQLSELPPGKKGEVSRLMDQSTENLRYLEAKGLVLGATVKMIQREAYDHLTHIEVDGKPQIVGETTSRFVMVKPLT